MKNRDIIVIASQAWDIEIGSNCKNIAIELAKNNRVLYVNPPLDRITKLKKKSDPFVQKRIQMIENPDSAFVEIGSNIWTIYTPTVIESINWLKPGFIYDFINKLNGKKYAKQILGAISKLGFKETVIFNDSYMFCGLYLKELLKPSLQVYYIRDNLVSQAYYKRHGSYIEPKLIKKVDLVLANSTYLQKYALKFNLSSFYVGQGCDTEVFDNLHAITAPSVLSNIPYPRIGYIGYLTSLRLDIELLRSIANLKPEWNIVLVGPMDQKFKESGLDSIKNIYFLGSVPTNEAANYIKGFDVCINPQLVNDLTIGNYPRKIDEYLGLGKPVVATLTEAMEIFKDFTFLAENLEDYIRLIKVALAEQDDQKVQDRIRFAKSHSWVENVKLISEYMIKREREL